MPVGESDKGFSAQKGDIYFGVQTSYTTINWWHEALEAEQFEHSGLLNTYLLQPKGIFGISEKFNISYSTTLGLREMHWYVAEESVHHRDENTRSNFLNAIGSVLGDSRFILRYLLKDVGTEMGYRIYTGSGLVIPGSSVLTSDPFFLSGELLKEHRHFSLSSGAYKAIMETQMFLKRNVNPVFLGGFIVIEYPIAESKYGYLPPIATNVSLSASFMRYDELMSSIDIGLTMSHSSHGKWNGLPETNSESLVLSPSIGYLFNTKFGAVALNLQKPFMIFGAFAQNEGDIDQRSDVWQISLALRFLSNRE